MNRFCNCAARFARRALGLLRGRRAAICALALSLAGILLYTSSEIRALYIRDGADTLLRFTASDEQDAQRLLDRHGIATMAFDVVDYQQLAGKVVEIDIRRAFPVRLTVDGRTYHLMTTEKTVEQLLEETGIALGDYDEVSPPRRVYVMEGDHLVVTRVHLETKTVEEAIPYEVEYRDNCLLPAGRSRTLVAGQAGTRLVTYAKRYENGQLVSEEVLDEQVVRQPSDAVVLVGSRAAVSPLDFGVPIGPDGAPLHYKKVLTNQVATGYSAGSGAWGASGATLSAGHVAVRAADIPYGTKMYITSADGSFVYGFAVASDTGWGLLNHVIDVDLYYDTYVESCLNGRKNVNIYIL